MMIILILYITEKSEGMRNKWFDLERTELLKSNSSLFLFFFTQNYKWCYYVFGYFSYIEVISIDERGNFDWAFR